MWESHSLTGMHKGHNDSIGCVVTECKYHDKNENFCTLEHIDVTKHESNATKAECTDCGSFEKA